VTATPSEQAVPQACLDALDAADEGFDIAADFAGILQDAVEAVAAFDAEGIRKASKKLDKINERLDSVSSDYVAAKSECRSHA
jgi:hypothetical protein